MRLTGQITRYAPRMRMPAHADGCRRLSVLVAGAQEEHAGRRSSGVTECGSIAVKAADVVHCNRFGDGGATIVSLEIPDDAVRALGHRPEALVSWRWCAGAAANAAGLRIAIGICRRDAPLVEECLIEILAESSTDPHRDRRPPPERLRRIRERLHDEPDVMPSVRQLAMAEGMHPVSLGRAFRRAFGCSITRYRQRVRAARAARALLAGRKPLVQVALDHGYADSSHLTRLFHREIGAPPQRFAAALRAPLGPGLESFKTTWAIDV